MFPCLSGGYLSGLSLKATQLRSRCAPTRASSAIGVQHSDDCVRTRRLGLDERVNAELDVVDKAWFATDIASAWVFGTDRNDFAWQ